jgi:hypothetical protein
MPGIVVRTLSEDVGSLFSGVRIALLGIEFDLLFDTTGANPGPWPALSGDQVNSSLKKTSASTL